MVRIAALALAHVADAREEALRFTLVCLCAASLILAGPALPFSF